MKPKTTLKKLTCLCLSLLLLVSLVACGAKSEDMGMENAMDMEIGNTPNYQYSANLGDPSDGVPTEDAGEDGTSALRENPFEKTAESPTSTFAADVDTASYTLLRKLAASGYTAEELKRQIQSNPLRTEELVNYFDYSYAAPGEGELFGQTASIVKSPWNEDTYLMVLGLATQVMESKGANNLVFLIDVSGSMASADKLPLLQNAFGTLVSALDERDTVSIVTYSGKESVVLEGCPGDRDEQIMAAINSLKASGSTNGESGLRMAYELAAEYKNSDGNNRIILASDGDLNVGISSPEELKTYISEKRDEGIFLSVLGFGTGNYRDDTMSALAQNGNGVYYYIDCAREAEKVLGTDLLATLYTVGKDVKLQLTFDATYVSEYRLIGYENRMLATEDFNDDEKDGGEVGAGHTLTVCYELKLTDQATGDGGSTADWMTLAIRYKKPDETDSNLTETKLGGSLLTDTPSADTQFVAAVIETAMILNGSAYNAAAVDLETVYGQLAALELGDDADKVEFRAMIEKLL